MLIPNLSTKATKNLALITAIYSLFKIILRIIEIIQSYFNIGDNPLIPKYLIKYIAFPLLFIIPFFGIIGYLSFKQFRAFKPKTGIVLVCFLLAILYFLFEIHIYGYIQSVNPYGS